MKATAIAPANIAFIKYWGKKDEMLRLPLNSSISMNLSGAYTVTTVKWLQDIDEDSVTFLSDSKFTKFKHVRENGELRIVEHLDRLRKMSGTNMKAKVVTKNSFPAGAGIASSASGFAALTVAAVAALGLQLSEKELSILARLGSGSACRSIPDGFVEWEEGSPAGGSETSYAHSLYPPEHWDLRDIVIIVQSQSKDISSTSGMEQVRTSPKLAARLAALPDRVRRVKEALAKKDIILLGETIEEECLDMHAVMQSQTPALMYWTDETKHLMTLIKQWRKEGLAIYFTIDAGPNVHIICEGKDEEEVIKLLRSRIWLRQTVKEIIVNKPAKGARVIKNHLF